MVVPAALCATVAVAGWVAVGPAGLDSRTIANAETPIEVIQIATAAVRAAPPIVTPEQPPSIREVAASLCLSWRETKPGTRRLDRKARQGKRRHPMSDFRSMSEPGPKPVLLAAKSSTESLHKADTPAANSKALDACAEPDVCIDQYLWSLYERTQKVTPSRLRSELRRRSRSRARCGPSSKL